MEQANYLIDLIYKALKNQDNHTRSKAENELMNIRNNNPSGFFSTCANLICDQNNDQFIRISASTIISRSLSFNVAVQDGFWDKLTYQIKNNIKNCLLSTLIDNNLTIIKAGAHAISAIAALQLSRGQWLDLADILATNTTHSEPNIRNAAIITIGYICQQLRFANVTIEQYICKQLLGGIICGSQDAQTQIIRTSLVALRNSMHMMKILFGAPQVRNKVFDILYSNINNENYLQEVYEGLFEFSKACYNFLGDYFKVMTEFIVAHLSLKNQKSVLALQLIDTIGSQYIQLTEINQNRITVQTNTQPPINYLVCQQTKFLPQIMRCFLIQNEQDFDNTDLRISASRALGSMLACGNQETIDAVVNGAASMINSDNPGFKQACAPLLSTLCQYHNRQTVKYYIDNAIEPTLRLLNQNSDIVISNTLSGLSMIAEFFPQLFYNQKFISEIISKFFDLLRNYSKNSKIIFSVLAFFKNISQGFNEQDQNIILSDPRIMLNNIIQQLDRALADYTGQNIQKVQELTLTTMNFLHNLRQKSTLYQVKDFFIQKFWHFFNLNNHKYERVLSLIIIILQCSLFTLSKTTSSPKSEIMDKIIHIIDAYISRYQVQESALQLIGAMCIGYRQSFQKKVADFWPYIFHALKMVQHPSIIKAALQATGDISRCYQKKYNKQFRETMEAYFTLLHTAQLQRNIKIGIIQSIGDGFIGLGQQSQEYIDDLFSLCDLCFEAIEQLSKNPSDKQYIERLQMALIETYSCAVFSVFSGSSPSYKDQNKYEKFSNHYQKIIVFVKKTSSRLKQPPVEYVVACLSLINDLTAFLIQYQNRKGIILQTIADRQIQELVRSLDKFNIRQDIRELQDTIHSQSY